MKKSFQFDEVIVERGSEASPIYRNLRQKLPAHAVFE